MIIFTNTCFEQIVFFFFFALGISLYLSLRKEVTVHFCFKKREKKIGHRIHLRENEDLLL